MSEEEYTPEGARKGGSVLYRVLSTSKSTGAQTVEFVSEDYDAARMEFHKRQRISELWSTSFERIFESEADPTDPAQDIVIRSSNTTDRNAPPSDKRNTFDPGLPPGVTFDSDAAPPLLAVDRVTEKPRQ